MTNAMIYYKTRPSKLHLMYFEVPVQQDVGII